MRALAGASREGCLAVATEVAGAGEPFGELAQLGERLVCNQEVTGSIPVFSTTHFRAL